MRASVAVAKAREFISGPHSLKAFCDKPLAPRTQSNQRGQKILTSFMKILCEKLASSSGLRASNMYPDYKYSSNSSDTSLEISLYSSGLISSCIKSGLIASLHCLLVTFFTNVFVWESLGILTVTFPDGFMNTIFTPCFRRSSTFIWLSISLSCTNKADEVFTAFSKVRDAWEEERLSTESYQSGNEHVQILIPPRWTSFIWRVKVSYASFHWSRRRCSCIHDKVVQLA